MTSLDPHLLKSFDTASLQQCKWRSTLRNSLEDSTVNRHISQLRQRPSLTSISLNDWVAGTAHYPDYLQTSIDEKQWKELNRIDISIGESPQSSFEAMITFVLGEHYTAHPVDFVRELTAFFQDSYTESLCAVYGVSPDTLASHEMYGVISTSAISAVCILTDAAIALRAAVQNVQLPSVEDSKECAYELCSTHERVALLGLRIP